MTTLTAPDLTTLAQHLLALPADFAGEPRIGKNPGVDVPALIHDVGRAFGHALPLTFLQGFVGASATRDRNRLCLALRLVWLLHAPVLRGHHADREKFEGLFTTVLGDLAARHSATDYLSDDERREELLRLTLYNLDLVPAGETAAQAEDRLARVSGLQRAQLLAASRAAEARARAVREALLRKAAEESADKWTRE